MNKENDKPVNHITPTTEDLSEKTLYDSMDSVNVANTSYTPKINPQPPQKDVPQNISLDDKPTTDNNKQ